MTGASSRIAMPIIPPNSSDRTNVAAISVLSSAPCACAVIPVTPMRRKPKVQKTRLMIVAPSATPPRSAASPMRPITATSTSPTSGTNAWPTMIGQACRNTARRVSLAMKSPLDEPAGQGKVADARGGPVVLVVTKVSQYAASAAVMRIIKLLPLRLLGGIALVAAAAPGLAQNVAPTPTVGSGRFAGQVFAASFAKRATNLQRPPIEINLLDVIALQDRAARNARSAPSASIAGRPGRN
jgi:hypothetical protein